MSDSWSRRRLLSAAAMSIGLLSLAGCSTRNSDSQSVLPIEIANFTTEEQYLDVAVVRRNAEDLDEGTVLRESYELEPTEGDGEEYTVPDVPTVPNRRYLVRAAIGGTRIPTAHYHYVPDCIGVEDHDDRLYVSVTPSEQGDTVSFDQNGCQ